MVCVLGQACDWTAEFSREEENKSKKERAGERGEAHPAAHPTPMHTHPGLEEGTATSLQRVRVCQR